MALKLDIRKAFDTMRWSFLLEVLDCMVFDQHFRDLINSILHFARLSISINGKLEGYFSCSRGVRQGDPLSPFLFAIGEEVLSLMMGYRGGIRYITPMEAKPGVTVPLTLLNADDVMFFYKATKENVSLIRDILAQYGDSSGQVVSPFKSRVFFGRRVNIHFKHYFFNSLPFVEGSVPFNYLGVPIFFGKPKIMHLNPIADKILLKFDRWNGKLFSLAGRACLVNSVITSSLTHSMMIYRWPRMLLKRVDRAMCNFIWNGNILKDSHGNALWSRVCSPHAEGGLGIRDIRAANEAFLHKFAWEIISGKDLGLQFILQRHSNAVGLEVRYFIASSIWHGLSRIRAAICANSRWLPGNVSSVKFLTDNWLGYVILDKIGLSSEGCIDLNQCISDFRSPTGWVLGSRFAEEFLDI